MDITQLVKFALENNASDIHLTEGMPPILRINGRLRSTKKPPFKREDLKEFIYQNIFNKDRIAQFEKELELDVSFEVPNLCRFRVNIHKQRGSVEAAFRLIPSKIRSIEELGLPSTIAELARRPDGLVLVTGPTGSGKSTTLAAMVSLMNNEKGCHIITIEDPIEYVYTNNKSIIKQREVYSDTHSFAEALKRALRQDPNVIVVGEMRDLETISTALTASETGHLVLATLHTPNAAGSIDRIIDVFPSHQQTQVRVQLADTLQGIISQQLLPTADGKGRVLSYEILIATPAIRNLIREQKSTEIATYMQTGQQYGMKLMDVSLRELYEQGLISYEVARSRMRNPEDFKKYY